MEKTREEQFREILDSQIKYLEEILLDQMDATFCTAKGIAKKLENGNILNSCGEFQGIHHVEMNIARLCALREIKGLFANVFREKQVQ